MALTPVAERLALELSLSVLRLRSVTVGIRTPHLPLVRQYRGGTLNDVFSIKRFVQSFKHEMLMVV